ncbi:MAG: carboxypeptidase regulatory-like domain-containing protein [Candidatus Binatia bacterium]
MIRTWQRAVVVLVLVSVSAWTAVTHAQQLCVGDCNGNDQVTVDELLTMVNIALGNAGISTCRAGDANDDGQISVDEILTAVNNSLNGCPLSPSATPTPTVTSTATVMSTPTSTPTVTMPPTVGSLSGTVRSSKGAVAGAQVCVAGSTICATSGSDGTYTLSAVSPGSVFVSASATGFLPGETRQAAFLTAGASLQGVDVMLSGRPTSAATYVGSNLCVTCHTALNPSLVAAWRGSAHVGAVDRTTAHVDVTGWPAAPADCTAPAALDAGFTASDPNPAILQDREVYLVRWKAGCAGKPEFAMAFDTNQNGAIDTGDTIIPVNGSMGGVATGAGQCGNGGIIPANAPCSANLGGSGSSAAKGWWQQEYLVDIGAAGKPSWVTWDTTNTPTDALILPAAWNQRSKQWVAAPDYNPTQDGTYSKACAGCHDTGLSLSADDSGHVTSYSRVDPYIGCEKCHGPGSAHVSAGGDTQLIVNPSYLTAQSEREVCGQCHSQGVSSTSPTGVFGFAWNSGAAVGGGNFIPGVHRLSDFQSAPAYGDPDFYWPSGFPSVDHITSVDFEANVHVNNPYEKLTCADCHSGHGGAGGPLQFQRTNGQTGDRYVFQNNDATLRDDVLCLSCHATQGSFASLALEDVGRYHISAGGSVQKNGTAWVVSVDDQAKSASAVASAVRSHMITQAAMPAYFDPNGTIGTPVGRCSSCHMTKTAFTASFYSGPDASGKTANVIGDVTSHTFRVAWPDMSLVTVAGATSWDGVMPNACGACHPEYRFGK